MMKKILLVFFLIFSVLIVSEKISRKTGTFLSFSNNPVYGSISGENAISGRVIIKETGLPVQSGCVKALKYDWAKDMILVVDSCGISSSGLYSLPHVPKDSLFIMAYSDDESADFPPGYHDTSINWQTSVRVIPSSNLQDVNIKVNLISNDTEFPFRIGGRIMKDPHNPGDYIKDAIIYARHGVTYEGFGISDRNGYYYIDSLPAGYIELVAMRIGYEKDYRYIQVGEYNTDTINFYLARVSSVNIPVLKIPAEYSLSQNIPNPFNPVTRIRIDIPRNSSIFKSSVKLVIYDVTGKEVAVLIDGLLKPGIYEVEWDGTNYTSGVYFYKLITDGYIKTRKMVLIK